MAGSDVPIMCTLSRNSVVERLTRFEGLFAEGLTGVEREPLLLRLRFDADEAREKTICGLFAAEEQCCAFLGFAYTRTEAGLVVEVSAPQDAAPTLDGMQQLAERNAPPETVAQGWTP
jgi:hypothetical protein